MIVTIHDRHAIRRIVRVARATAHVSTRDATRPPPLRDRRHRAVPRDPRDQLTLSEAALVGLGLPTGPVIASIHEKRDEFRHELQEAAGQAGQAETRAIRASTSRES